MGRVGMNADGNGNDPYSYFPLSACLSAEICALLRYSTITDVTF